MPPIRGQPWKDSSWRGLISDENNALKPPGDHIDFDWNVKIILSPLFDARKSIYTKKNVPKTFDFLVSFVPFDTKYRGTRS